MSIRKKTVILIAIAVIYAIALPLALYFSGAFKREAAPDLNTSEMYYDPQYVNKTDAEKSELLAEIGLDLQSFSAEGFHLSLQGIMVFVYGNQPDSVCYFKTHITGSETCYITLTVYMPSAESLQLHRFGYPYERREINGKPVGFYESSDMFDGQCFIRYKDSQSGCVYLIEPFIGFDELTESFLNLLIK